MSECAVQSICDYLISPGGSIEISNNASGCNSKDEVEEACETLSVGEVSLAGNITTLPNPFTTSTTIEYNLQQPATVLITIYNHLGEQIEIIQQNQTKGKQLISWDATGLPSGVYFCEIETNVGIQTIKLIKLK